MNQPELAHVERFLQACVAALAAIGTTLLGMGQGNAILPSAAALVAIASYALTDRLGLIRSPRWMTNIAMMVALFLVAGDVFQQQGTMQVLVVANFLVYLQMILQFQKKDARLYRYLLVISLFQVVSAGVFQQSFLFVFLLACYLALGMTALILLAIFDQLRDASQVVSPEGVGRKGPAASPLPAWQGLEIAASASRRKLREFNASLLARLVLLVGGTITLAVILFISVPRLSGGVWHGAGGHLVRGIGFSNQLRLGEVGSLLEDSSPVMRVQFEDAYSGNSVPISGPIYLRGGSFTHYADRRWVDAFAPWSPVLINLPTLSPQPGRRFIRQRITLEPIESPQLFGVWPYGPARDGSFLYDPVNTRLFRVSGSTEQRTTYSLLTTAFSGLTMADWVPAREPVPVHVYLQVPQDISREEWYRQFRRPQMPYEFWGSPPQPQMPPPPPGGRDRLRQLADDWAAEFAQQTGSAPSGATGSDPGSKAHPPAKDHYRLARFFERKLASFGHYRYSLASPPRNPVLDPVVDFLTDHREGHCEYFATALALLLRCRGVPTRVVIGFKSEDYNPLGDFYQVRQQDAHAWVEVYLSPDQIPERLRVEAPESWFTHGIWLRLDPTPPDRDAMSAARNPWNRLTHTFTWLDFVWLRYIVQMDRPRQREEVYQPAMAHSRQLMQAIWRRTLGRKDVSEGLRAMRSALASTAGRTAMLSAAALLVPLAVGWWTWWRRPVRRAKLLRRLGVRSGYLISPKRLGLEFYHEFEKLLAAHGRHRPAGCTPWRFIEEAAESITATSHPHGADRELLDLGRKIVELYYRGRFAGRLPGPEETAFALDALERWQTALRGSGESSTPPTACNA